MTGACDIIENGQTPDWMRNSAPYRDDAPASPNDI